MAAVVITHVNILGGLTIGVLQQGMSLSAAAQTYTLLTVGGAPGRAGAGAHRRPLPVS